MKMTYSRPIVVNAGMAELENVETNDGLFPIVAAAAEGYMAGKALKKVLGGAVPANVSEGLVSRKAFKS